MLKFISCLSIVAVIATSLPTEAAPKSQQNCQSSTSYIEFVNGKCVDFSGTSVSQISKQTLAESKLLLAIDSQNAQYEKLFEDKEFIIAFNKGSEKLINKRSYIVRFIITTSPIQR
jgi:hypothetical protein